MYNIYLICLRLRPIRTHKKSHAKCEWGMDYITHALASLLQLTAFTIYISPASVKVKNSHSEACQRGLWVGGHAHAQRKVRLNCVRPGARRCKEKARLESEMFALIALPTKMFVRLCCARPCTASPPAWVTALLLIRSLCLLWFIALQFIWCAATQIAHTPRIRLRFWVRR